MEPTKQAKPKIGKGEPSFMARWAARYFRQITFIVCFLVLVFAYFVLISPALARVRSEAGADLASEKKINAGLQARLSYLVSLQERRKRMSNEEINKLQGAIPSSPEISTLLSSFEFIARASSSIIEGVEFSLPDNKSDQSQPAASQGLSIVEARIAVSSDGYEALKILLAGLSKSERIIDVVGLAYDPSLKSYNIVAHAYYQPE